MSELTEFGLPNSSIYSSKSSPKKTLSLTVRQDLLPLAREHGINLLKLLESSLIQILAPQTKGFSLSEGSLFPKRESSRAGSSVWYECLTCTQEVGGSNPPQSISTSPQLIPGLLKTLLYWIIISVFWRSCSRQSRTRTRCARAL